MLILLLTTVAQLETYFAKTDLVQLCIMKERVFLSFKKFTHLKKNLNSWSRLYGEKSKHFLLKFSY